MTMKYWRLRLEGERSADEAQSVVGQTGGNIVRLHTEGGETHVYFAAESLVIPESARTMMGSAMLEEVSLEEVTTIS